MQERLNSRRDVFLAAVVTTILCMAFAHLSVAVLHPGPQPALITRLTLINTLIIALPVSYFIWWQVRKNALLNSKLQSLLNRDRLTDAATRDFFFARMEENPAAYGVSLMVDIDEFKDVNDTHGHLAGDAVISRVAGILRHNIRADDIVCRFGGEEFVIFLSRKDRSGGIEVAERMRKMIAADVLKFGGKDVRVTVSIGGSLKERLVDVNLAIKQADEALYRAKSGGRNMTVFSDLPAYQSDHAPP